MLELLFLPPVSTVTLALDPPAGQGISITSPSVDPAVVAEAVAPVREAIAAERARQAGLPSAGTVADSLVRMGHLDQVARRSVQDLDLSSLSTAEANAVRARALGLVHEIDLENQAAFRNIAPTDRWITFEEYGEEASRAAFFIVQHSNEELWRIYVPLLEPLVGTGQIDDAQYALMHDRLSIEEGRPQRYGSQWICEGRMLVLAPLEGNAAAVDQRRASMGMISLADNAKRFEAVNPCLLNR